MDSAIINYKETQGKAMIGNKEFVTRNLRPVFANESERQSAKRKIETRLYKVFSRYMPN